MQFSPHPLERPASPSLSTDSGSHDPIVETLWPRSSSLSRPGIPKATQSIPKTTLRRIGRRIPSLLAALFLGSLALACGHDAYYHHLEGGLVRSVEQQIWALRSGNAVAFAVRVCLVNVVGISSVQLMWKTFLEKPMTIAAIDSMLAVLGNPTALLNLDMASNAKTILVLALVSWLLPAIVIFTPATLSIQSQLTTFTIMSAAPTANFSDAQALYWADYYGAGYISGPSSWAFRVFTETLSTNKITQYPSPHPNSTYDLSFWGPSYQCLDLGHFAGKKGEPTWNTTEFSYFSISEAFNSTVNLKPGQRYIAEAPEFMPNSIMIRALGRGPDVMIICQLYNTSFDVSIQFSDGVQSVVPRSVQLLELQTGFIKGVALPDPGDGSMNSSPHYILQTYFITYLLFKSLLRVIIFEAGTSSSGPEISGDCGGAALLGQSALVFCPEISRFITDYDGISDWNQPDMTWDQPELCRNGSLARAIEDLSRNFTYSTIPYLQTGDTMAQLPVTITSSGNHYIYDRATLLLAYGAAFLASLICLILGAVALRDNGFEGSTTFSSILLTTRNADLDRLVSDHMFGSLVLPKEIMAVKIRFGRVEGLDEIYRTAFGLDGTVEPLNE